MKKRLSAILFLALLTGFAGVYHVYGNTSDKSQCIALLESYGWAVADATESVTVTIPPEFDLVYKNYNNLQLKSGFDLTPYRGKTGTRYTFIITNYPTDTGETVYANVITIEGKPVGGDIMTVSLGGFMHGIAENAPTQKCAN